MDVITVLDGGMGKHLRRIGAPFRQPEWSALALMDGPDFVVKAHADFIEAGAQMIITNNYAVVPFHLGDDAMAERGTELIDRSGLLARRAADEAIAADPQRAPVSVAGSLPPLFGSYEPERFDPERAPALYGQIVAALAPHVDVWLTETFSRVDEFDIAAEAVRTNGRGKRLWAAFSVPDEGAPGVVRSGETVRDLVDGIERHADTVDAVLFNCSQPERIGPALAELHRELAERNISVRTGGYANAFADEAEEAPPDIAYAANNTILRRRDDLTAERYADVVQGWVDDGATIVGGCCDMYPEHIAALAARFA